MRHWSRRRILAGLLSAVLVGSMLLTGCSTDEKEDIKNQQGQEDSGEFKPLSTTSKKVVAKYQGGQITEGELNRYINIFSFFSPQIGMMLTASEMSEQVSEIKEQLSKEYAGQLYISSKMKDEETYFKKADETLKELDEEFKTAATQDPKGPKSVDEAIKGKGFNKEELRKFIARDFQLRAYYDEQFKKEQYDAVKVDHILIALENAQTKEPLRTDAEAKKRAEEVKKKLDAGGDFAKLAKEYSDDPGSKDQGGKIEGAADQFVPEFAQAAKTLPLNQVSGLVKTDYGYHILKVIERKKESVTQAPDEYKGKKSQDIFMEILDKEVHYESFMPKPEPAKK
ncbi:peptidylprolyl isomerase [Hazenella coriacea]|uniref:Foldase protein PrsA n=1 Tax=Hazenella coriacea TaxID=1179467 RepID=A0A4R3L4P2_9BACL|nr:peptidylprolyl isomerase [Hazenella coriacea]TCS94292.1 foldase protein PrsA [Hazenella coriacea]